MQFKLCILRSFYSSCEGGGFNSIDKIIDDFKILKKFFYNIERILIVGGEPLLHPRLEEIFEPLRKLYPKSEIVIVTNGILLEKKEDNFYKMLKKFDISLTMTKYPINVDCEKYIQKCNKMGIKSYLFSFNRNKMQKLNLETSGKNDKQRAFDICSRKKCHFLKDGKIYLCTVAPNIHYLNEQFGLNFELTDKDYIDLKKVKNVSQINEFLNKPVEFCKYCTDKEAVFEKWKISEKELDEWVLK